MDNTRKLILALYKVIASKVVIPKKLETYIKASNLSSLSDIGNWKVYTHIGNSGGDIGAWDDVGYVAFDAKTGTVIPISRGDEHHAGHELIDYLINKQIIPNLNYESIWVGSNSPNYLNKVNIDKWIPIYKSWLALGGKNTKVQIDINNTTYVISMKDLVENGKPILFEKGKLFPIGKEFISLLDEIVKMYKKALNSSIYEKSLSKEVSKLAKFLHEQNEIFDFITDADSTNILENIIVNLNKNEKGIDECLSPLLGMNGLKNKFHNKLRKFQNVKDIKTVDPTDRREYKEYKGFFGDLNLAKNEFDRISNI